MMAADRDAARAQMPETADSFLCKLGGVDVGNENDMMLLSGRKSFSSGRQQLAFFGVQLILIKQEMGRNVRHICRLRRQLEQDLESRCRLLAELSTHRRVEMFCSSFE